MNKQINNDEGAMSPYDKVFPILTIYGDETSTHIYIFSAIEKPSDVIEIVTTLLAAVAGETIYIHLNTPGGCLYSTISIINAIAECRAKTVAICSGGVASGGTVIALSCDELIAEPNLEFMVHWYSSAVGGKGGDMEAYIKFAQQHAKKIYYDIYYPFLTEAEISKVIKQKDIYLTSEEVTERFARVIEHRNKLAAQASSDAYEESIQRAISDLSGLGYNITKVEE